MALPVLILREGVDSMEHCIYEGKVHMENMMCWRCSLFLEVCTPVASRSGYGMGSELDCWLCEGCQERCKRAWF